MTICPKAQNSTGKKPLNQPHTIMLQLNIKSSSYMCLDIDPESVIHKHLFKKVTDLTVGVGHSFNTIISNEFPEDMHDHYSSKHNLTMLPSFHISLGAPFRPTVRATKEYIEPHKIFIHELIGVISLADIYVSQTENKKSAWISIKDYHHTLHTGINVISVDYPKSKLHISLANLTGNPHDSIARPEDCIIDTITA